MPADLRVMKRSPYGVLFLFALLASAALSSASPDYASAADDVTEPGIALLQTGVARVPAVLIGATVRRVDLAASEAQSEDGLGRGQGGPDPEAATRLLDSVYEGHLTDPFYIAINRDTAGEEISAKTGSDRAAVYGELLPASVVDLLLRQLKVQPGQKYYDLGSGFGKTAAMAYLLGLNATGVELAHERWDAACAALARLRGAAAGTPRGPGLQFVKASFLDVDFSDADVVFTDSVMFSPEMLAGLGRAAARLRPGALVVSAQAKGLPGPGLRYVAEWMGPTTWDNSSKWTIQRVVREPGETSVAQSTSLSAKPAHGATGSTANLNAPSDPVCTV